MIGVNARSKVVLVEVVRSYATIEKVLIGAGVRTTSIYPRCVTTIAAFLLAICIGPVFVKIGFEKKKLKFIVGGPVYVAVIIIILKGLSRVAVGPEIPVPSRTNTELVASKMD